ncbi:dihydromonapterin reductase [Thiomicrospira sp. R3]|uniref:dihydromonapterin reductase n=1 Tax=Thiomicrospira sp. R3 TaxID=3035472 RepID=UPI00259B8633|nr:dihydromonapterin reductase [Thiomicrospira sp. R3]WFE67838.1 dihydromonapterin reductase [Thiomicrospira sp. R3]
MRLNNAIVITGAGQRIGYYLANQFLTHTDFPVIFSYRTERSGVAALQAKGGIAIRADFNQPGEIACFIEQVNQRVTSLRALIHNASVWLDDDAPTSFEQQMRLHVELPYQLNRGLVDPLNASAGADIISISDAKVARGSGHQVAYLASKAALQSMTKSFALAYGSKVKVNDIAPALIMFNQGDDAEYRQQRLKENLIPIEPGPEVVWQTVNFIMSNPYLTGQVIGLDGGRNLMP